MEFILFLTFDMSIFRIIMIFLTNFDHIFNQDYPLLGQFCSIDPMVQYDQVYLS